MITKVKKISSFDIAIALLILAAAGYIFYRIKVSLHYNWNWGAIPQYLWRYDSDAERWIPNVLIQGLLTTIRLSIWSTLLATVIGTVMGLCRVSQGLFKRLVARSYVEVMRNLPPLVLVFLIYYFLSDQIMTALGLDDFIQSRSDFTMRIFNTLFAPPSLLVPFFSALMALAVFEGAYITEIIRAGIQSIERGIWEASYSLGLSRWQQMRHVILPLATQRILPPLGGQFISTIKDSAIVSVISVQELTFQGMELMSATYLNFEIWIVITLLYLTLTLSLALALGRLEIYLMRSET